VVHRSSLYYIYLSYVPITYISGGAVAGFLQKTEKLGRFQRVEKKCSKILSGNATHVAQFFVKCGSNNIYNNNNAFIAILFGRVLRTCRMYTHVARRSYNNIWKLCGTLLYDKNR